MVRVIQSSCLILERVNDMKKDSKIKMESTPLGENLMFSTKKECIGEVITRQDIPKLNQRIDDLESIVVALTNKTFGEIRDIKKEIHALAVVAVGGALVSIVFTTILFIINMITN